MAKTVEKTESACVDSALFDTIVTHAEFIFVLNQKRYVLMSILDKRHACFHTLLAHFFWPD